MDPLRDILTQCYQLLRPRQCMDTAEGSAPIKGDLDEIAAERWLDLAVMPVLLLAGETWTRSVRLYTAISFVDRSMIPRMEAIVTKDWRTMAGVTSRASGNAVSESGHQGDCEKMRTMLVTLRGSGQSKPDATWISWPTGTFTDGLELDAAGNSTSMTSGKSTVLNGRLWRETDWSSTIKFTRGTV